LNPEYAKFDIIDIPYMALTVVVSSCIVITIMMIDFPGTQRSNERGEPDMNELASALIALGGQCKDLLKEDIYA